MSQPQPLSRNARNALLTALVLAVALGSVQAQTTSRQVPTVVASAPAEGLLTEQELELAQQVHVGAKSCKLGGSVQIDPLADAPGHFRLTMAGQSFHMRTVTTNTGALRLEDRARGAIWIQLSNKSMLLSQRQSRRLADECTNSTQRAVAADLQLNPRPPLFVLEQAPRPN